MVSNGLPVDVLPDPLLVLLQLSDSALPIGSYSHSWGLEVAVQEARLASVNQVLDYLRGTLCQSIAPRDGAACHLAHTYSQTDDRVAFEHLQAYLSASQWATEPLRASLDTGKRLNRLARSTWGLACPIDSPVHHCAAFGWVCGVAGIDCEATVRAYLLTAVTGLVSAAVRLVPLGHSEGQRAIALLHADIHDLAPTCAIARQDEIHSFAPLQERDCQVHRTLYTRLFQS